MSTKDDLLKMKPTDMNDLVIEVIREKAETLTPNDSLKMMFDLENKLYLQEGNAAIRYGNGIHSKHKHINYHEFFRKNIESGESDLDIGSSNGELTYDIAKKAAPGRVVGIEIEEPKYRNAVNTYKLQNLEFVHGDATKDMPDEDFDVITLSNVLEHIKDRPGLLRTLIKKYHPKKVIIRVPMFERDWRVPLKKEIGIDYRLDDTHFIEYTKETFKEEMDSAGLDIVSMDIRWGEIWAVLKPKS